MSIRRRVPQCYINEEAIENELRAYGISYRNLSEDGVHDVLVGFRSVNYLLEMKSRYGKLTLSQNKFFEEWEGHKAVVRSVDEALRAIDWTD